MCGGGEDLVSESHKSQSGQLHTRVSLSQSLRCNISSESKSKARKESRSSVHSGTTPLGPRFATTQVSQQGQSGRGDVYLNLDFGTPELILWVAWGRFAHEGESSVYRTCLRLNAWV